MYKDEDILITGSNGLLGSNFKKLFPNAICITHRDFDLTSENEVKYMFYLYQPKVIVHLAAKVGSVNDNHNNQASYYDDNILMNTLMVKHSYLNKVERFIGILSSYMFPSEIDSFPIDENDIHKGSPAPSNLTYSYAKRALSIQIDSYNKQYGTKYNYLTPCNIYGEHEKVNQQKSHFIVAMLLKIKDAVKNNNKKITLFGDGTPLRQFLFAEDFCKILKIIIDEDIYESLNIATNDNLSILEVAKLALKVTNNEHLTIEFDKTKQNGQHRQDISNEKMKKTIPNFQFTSLEDGLLKTYNAL